MRLPLRLFRSIATAAIAVLIMSVLSSGSLQAQDPDSTWTDTADSTWDDVVLNPHDFDFGGELMEQYSHGWSPQPFYATSLSFTSDFLYVHVFDRATDLRSSSFRPTTAPSSWRNPFDGDGQ